MGKNYCAIKNCHNTAGVIGRFGIPVKLHHLPGDKSLRSAWIRAISRKYYRPSSYTQVCSDHFPGGNGRTWRYNVPTLFLPQKIQEEPHLRKTVNSKNTPWYMDLDVDMTLTVEDADAFEEPMPVEFERSIHS